MPQKHPAAWAGSLMEDWRQRAGRALQQAQLSVQQLQREAGQHAEEFFRALQRQNAQSQHKAPAFGSIALTAGRPDSSRSFPGRGARFTRGLNVVAELAAEPGGGGLSMGASDSAPAGGNEERPEEERILISEVRLPALYLFLVSWLHQTAAGGGTNRHQRGLFPCSFALG